jgi:hypothetical protein
MPDLLRRVASVTWEATKGAVTGAAFEAAGGIPVGSVIGKSAIATTAVKGLYQATALTTTADLLEGHLPTAKDFEGNAALIVPLNLILHGTPLRSGEAKQATMDVYAKDGTTPQETTEKLSAQPPVKPDMPEGLRPAIQVGEGVVEGEATESHDQLAARSLPIKPISMEELEANPDRADNVLQAPEIQDQDVIDRAWQIKKDAIDAEGVPDEDKAKSMEKQVKEQEELAAERKAAGEDPGEPKPPKEPQTIDELYDRAAMKSGRGFTTPDGKFLSRMEARKWVKDNEPDVHEMWLNEQDGDKQAELHSEDYAAARNRVQARNVTEGDPVMDAVPPDIRRTLAEARSGILNKVKAGLASEKYGYEAIRTLLVGPRNFFRAEGEQLASGLRKLIPDAVDQQALHFARDYRGEPDQLRADIEEVRSGDNEKLKAYIPAMERALEPMSPAMAQADQQMTDYFTQQLARGRALGTLDSGIDPSRYSPRMFMRAQEEGSGVGRPTFTDRTVNSIRRDYLHTLDPLKSGDTEARTFNAIDEMSIYNDRMATANSTSIFKTELQNSALGMESSRGKVPADWVPLTKQFEDKVRNEDGSYTVKNLYVPKDIANALKPLLEEPGQLSQLSKFLHVQSVIKGIELTLSAFHVKALNITALNNLGLVDYLRSIHSDNNAPDFQAIERRGAVHGLETTKTGIPFDSYMCLKSSEPATGLARLADNAIVNKADEVAKGISKYIFDNVQRKWKVTDFAKKEAGWIAKHPDATDSEYAAAMRGYAKEVNAAYGGLNWDVMGVSKGTQNVMRMFLLAPDWTFSNVANLKYALTDGGTAGAASRTFFVKSFATGFAMTAAASIFIGGKYDPTDVKHLDQVYLGTDDQGKEMYANWFFAGAPKDAMNLVKRTYSDGPLAGPAEVIISKASPIAGTVIDLGENKDYKGAQIYKRGDSIGSQAEDQGEYAAKKLLPITGVSALEGVTNALRDPNYEYSYKDVLSIAADLVGSPTTHSGAAASNSGGNSAKRFQSARTSGKSRFTIKGR